MLWSDNAKCFISASSRLLEIFGDQSPQWKFIVPRAPWWGGWWERLVGVIKSSLRKTLGLQSVSRIELETVLHEVEGIVNSRPLTFVGDEFDSGDVLTPAHFLIGRTSLLSKPSTPSSTTSDSNKLNKLYTAQTELAKGFWAIWREEYLRNLPPNKGASDVKEIQVGTIVLVESEGWRMEWPMGIVTKVFPGKDGVGRAIEVKTKRGIITRPVQRLHILEVYSPPQPGVTNTQSHSTDQNTKHTQSSDQCDTVATDNVINNEQAQDDTLVKVPHVTRGGRVTKRLQLK